MTEQAIFAVPMVQHELRRFETIDHRRARTQIESNLMHDGGGNPHRHAGKHALNAAMQMSTKYCDDPFPMSGKDSGKRIATNQQPATIHRFKPAAYWWVMHEDQHCPPCCGNQRAIEPAYLFLAERTVCPTRANRVQANQDQSASIDRVAPMACFWRRLMRMQDAPHRRRIIVVAGHDIHRQAQPGKTFRQRLVVGHITPLGEITGDQEDIRPRAAPTKCKYRCVERCVRIWPAIGRASGSSEMQVRQLSNQHYHLLLRITNANSPSISTPQ